LYALQWLRFENATVSYINPEELFAFVGVTSKKEKLRTIQAPLLSVPPTAEGLTILQPVLIDLPAPGCRASVVGGDAQRRLPGFKFSPLTAFRYFL